MTEDIVVVRVSIGSKLRDRAKLEAMASGVTFSKFLTCAIKQAVDKASEERAERNRVALEFVKARNMARMERNEKESNK